MGAQLTKDLDGDGAIDQYFHSGQRGTNILALLRAAGGEVFNETITECTLDEAGAVAGIEFMASPVLDHQVQPPPEMQVQELGITFNTGRMALGGTTCDSVRDLLWGQCLLHFPDAAVFKTILLDLDDAVRVDGGNTFTVFCRICLPLIRPALGIIFVFSFMFNWNNFLGPLIFLSDSDKYTLVLGLRFFQGQFRVEWALLMAVSLLVLLPRALLHCPEVLHTGHRRQQCVGLSGRSGLWP